MTFDLDKIYKLHDTLRNLEDIAISTCRLHKYKTMYYITRNSEYTFDLETNPSTGHTEIVSLPRPYH